jgi:putative ABC transport system permease protein
MNKKHPLSDLDADIRDHLERETQDNIERGMAPEEARYAALRKFGNTTLVHEDTRAVWIPKWLDQLKQDGRHAIRMFVRNPGFALVIVITLALGIGANTAIFSLIDALLLRYLPVRDPHQLVLVEMQLRDSRGPFGSFSYDIVRALAGSGHVAMRIVSAP